MSSMLGEGMGGGGIRLVISKFRLYSVVFSNFDSKCAFIFHLNMLRPNSRIKLSLTFLFLCLLQSNLYSAVTLGEWPSDRLIEVERLIQVAQNTRQTQNHLVNI